MIEIKIDGIDALLKKLETFGKQIEELHQSVPQELLEWQRDDMCRKFPNIEVENSGNETAASTEIWPHSRLKRRKSKRGGGPSGRSSTHRPISRRSSTGLSEPCRSRIAAHCRNQRDRFCAASWSRSCTTAW
jgi:hypothetical protein